MHVPAMLLLLLLVLGAPASAGEPADGEHIEPLPLPKPADGARWYAVRQGATRCGLRLVQPPRSTQTPGDAGSKIVPIVEHEQYAISLEQHLGVPLRQIVFQRFYTDAKTGAFRGFALWEQRLLSQDAKLPEGARFVPSDQVTRAVLIPGDKPGQRKLRVEIRRGTAGTFKHDFPLRSDDRFAPDLSFVHLEYDRTLQAQRDTYFAKAAGSGQTPDSPPVAAVFTLFRAEALNRVTLRARRLYRLRLRAASGQVYDAVAYEVITAAAEDTTGFGPKQRLYFRESDGALVRSVQGDTALGSAQWIIEIARPARVSELTRLTVLGRRLAADRMPFPPGEMVQYRILGRLGEFGRASFRITRAKSVDGAYYRIWSDLELRTSDVTGRTEEAQTFCTKALLPIRYEATGIVRAHPPQAPKPKAKSAEPETRPNAGQAEPAPAAEPGEAEPEERPVEQHRYRRVVSFHPDRIRAVAATDAKSRVSVEPSAGPVYLLDANLIHPWVFIAAGLPLEKGGAVRIAAYHARRMAVGIVQLIIGPKKKGVYVVQISSLRLGLSGHLYIRPDGTLLAFSQNYPGGGQITFRLVEE